MNYYHFHLIRGAGGSPVGAHVVPAKATETCGSCATCGKHGPRTPRRGGVKKAAARAAALAIFAGDFFEMASQLAQKLLVPANRLIPGRCATLNGPLS